MTLNWQDFVALAVVLAAAGYLVRLALSAVSRKSGVRACSSCAGCSSPDGQGSTVGEPLVSIGPTPPKA